MNILYYLLNRFLKEESTNIATMMILSIAITIAQTNIISYISAIIIQSVETRDRANTMQYFNYFIVVSVAFLIIYYGYKVVQNKLLTKLTQWIKREIFGIILLSNNENMNHVNFVEFITPITRISISCYALFFDIITVIIPTFAFLLMISVYFSYVNLTLGGGFIFANVCVLIYLRIFWGSLSSEKNAHEIKMNENEKFIIDILNNIDKVICRGQNKKEINRFSKMTNDCIDSGVQFLSYTTNHVMVMTGMVYLIIFGCTWYLILLQSRKKISTTMFITFFTVLLIYRERALATIQNIPDYLEFVGRLEYIIEYFNVMLGDKADLFKTVEKKYEPAGDMAFNKITFKRVDFVYSNHKKPHSTKVLDNFSITVDTQNKIIGMTGLSGKGKSSFAKLILRLYEPTAGNIYIDDVDIRGIDPNYIRQNVVYINQNSKLFDKKIIENIHYGCENTAHCEKHLEEIMKYEKIRNLFNNVDIHNDSAGSLGENLSGGQRQVVNIISGLINPAKILILDEPTNALDAELKKEVIALIGHYRKYKQCIVVITHDRDMYSIFDKIVSI